jgi:hypothetical protein
MNSFMNSFMNEFKKDPILLVLRISLAGIAVVTILAIYDASWWRVVMLWSIVSGMFAAYRRLGRTQK